MNNFKDFMDEAQEFPNQALMASSVTLTNIQTSLVATIGEILSPIAVGDDEKQKFSQEVSNLVKDGTFLSEFSEEIGVPIETESEEEFVNRGSDVLRKMLYKKFGIK
ncbi:MAG: hypothetical protein LH702_28690 [Phormidesmis sp. CAN_BIN44]|nr:hypothetical protein [Phormidesmis sp. CAN_BIN44]